MDADPAPLTRALGSGPARWLWEQHLVRSVRTRFGNVVRSLQRSDTECHLILVDHSVIDADAVVTGLGAVPNTEWLDGSGVDITDGVLTDAAGRAITAAGAVVEGVVAVGDVARTPSPTAGGRAVRHEHWVAASTSAQRAAATLTGQQPPREAPPVFWTDVYEHRVQVVGHPDGVESQPEPGSRGFCVRYEGGDGALIGAVVVNWPQRLPGSESADRTDGGDGMSELWRAHRAARVRGWRLSVDVAVRICCRLLAPTMVATARRNGRLGSLKASMEMTAPRRCRRSD